MRVILVSNILEHVRFGDYVRRICEDGARAGEGPTTFLGCGDLLDVFPEPGEDLASSIFAELYGLPDLQRELDALVERRFRAVADSPLVGPLREMFTPTGLTFESCRQAAARRYSVVLHRTSSALGPDDRFVSIPGNMDYPDLASRIAASYRGVSVIDQQVLKIGRYRIGMLGGIPNRSHPFRDCCEISPYEMAPEEYERRIKLLWGVDGLVTHLSPEECPALQCFLEKSPARFLISRAPFNFGRRGNYRGDLAWYAMGSKKVLLVRPFDCPTNRAWKLDLSLPDDDPNFLSECAVSLDVDLPR